MKDLLVFVADADIGAFMTGLLGHPRRLAIRPVTCDVIAHQLHDSGMITTGPELASLRKHLYNKALLIWDHHGSGQERKHTPDQCANQIGSRMGSVTWSGRHAPIVLEPEFEQWLWHCEPAVQAYLKVSPDTWQEWVNAFAHDAGTSTDRVKLEQPKELFTAIMTKRLHRSVSPRDFKEIGGRAGVARLLGCPSFAAVATALRGWFPTI